MRNTDIENAREARKVLVLETGTWLDIGLGSPIFRHDHRGGSDAFTASLPLVVSDEGVVDGKIRGRRVCAA